MSKFITRFWAGKTMPDEYKRYGELWQELNPEHYLVEASESDIHDFPELWPVFEDLYKRDAGRKGIELYVQMADIMGYALIERHGGIYINCDMQPVRPLFVPPPRAAWASYENDEDGRIVNAAIGASEPHNPFWIDLLQNLPERYFANPTDEMIMTTGPGYLTDFVARTKHNFAVYSKNTFNPVHWKQIAPGGNAEAWLDRLPAETIAVHHWGHKRDGRSNVVETATQ